VTRIFDISAPEPDKQLIKQVKDLMHGFAKAVLVAINTPEPE